MAAATPAIQPPSRKELFQLPRAPIAPTPAGQFSPACVDFWNRVRGLDMSQADLNLPATPSGCDNLPGSLAKWHQAYLKACLGVAKPGDPPVASGKRSQACDAALYDYRANLTEALTSQTPLKDISDSKVLTDKMVARLLQDRSDPTKVAEVAERMLEINPGMPEALQADAVSRLNAAQFAAGKPDDPRWEEADKALEGLSALKDSDPRSYYETKLYEEYLRYLDPERVRQQAEEVDREHPDLGVGPYHEAWAEFQNGNKQRAQQLLQEALHREPGNSRFQATLDELRSGEANPFVPSMGFSLVPP
jgi:tetratricopeptide (TPR) repeat protein